MDYTGTTQTLGLFDNSTRRLCAEIEIIDDIVCESNPYPEDFSVSMVIDMPNITVAPSRIGVAIDDTSEPECGECIYNQSKTICVCVYSRKIL